MPTLLYIQTSPRGDESYSVRAARAFLQEFGRAHPQWRVDHIDLAADCIPAFTAPAAKAKYTVLNGQMPADEAGWAWKDVFNLIDRFKSADAYLISSPMWNFGLPYRLKQYIDNLVQPALTFSYSPQTGYKGLVTGKPAVLVLARGGSYGSDPASDFQRPYLEMILRFIGFTDIRSVLIEPTLAGVEPAEKALQQAIGQARELARNIL
jgi:FMN-dependent NADH-azoreductase